MVAVGDIEQTSHQKAATIWQKMQRFAVYAPAYT